MSALVSENRLYRGDCLEVLKQLDKEGVRPDCIYLDPPFNSNRVYNFVFRGEGEGAEQVAFRDMWNDKHADQLRFAFTEMLNGLDVSDTIKRMVELWVNVLLHGDCDDRRLLNYLVYMTERLILMQKILSPQGNIYLHCDPTASHYLKVMMDAVFGRENFRNEIIWSYRTGGASKRDFAKKHDVILRYTKSNKWHFFGLKERAYTKSPKRKAGIINYGGGNAEFFEDEDGRVYNLVNMRDVWDIPYIGSTNKERVGYGTQKPLALLERIINASCPTGGLVLDPFCGCGTTVEAADKLERLWIGVDISAIAVEHVQERLKEKRHKKVKRDYVMKECDPQTMLEYGRLSHYAKQAILVGRIGGIVGRRGGGDRGVDGVLTVHVGDDEKGAPKWGKMILSVKTGNQGTPAHVRELRGTMMAQNAIMGGLILDKEPTKEMLREANSVGKFVYKTGNFVDKFPRLQILTADDVLGGIAFNTPPHLIRKKMDDKGRSGVL